MKILHLTLLKEQKLIIDKDLNYFINEDKMDFVDGDTAYKIYLKEKIFMKKDKESLIKLNFKDKNVYIKLLDANLEFDMKIKKCKYQLKDDSLIIEYILDDGDNTLNTISIYY